MNFLIHLITSIILLFPLTLLHPPTLAQAAAGSLAGDNPLTSFTATRWNKPSVTQGQPALQDRRIMTPTCLVYPLTVRQSIISAATLGDSIDIFDGNGPDDFGWLGWNGLPTTNLDSSYLEAELRYPQMSLNDYTNAWEFADHILDVGDRVASLEGVNSTVEPVLEELVGRELIIPVWDNFSTGNPDTYHISDFILARIESTADIDLISTKIVLATYLGPVTLEQCPYLTLTKTGPTTAAAGSPITYTLTLSNSGNLTATNLVLTDAIPAYATYLSGGVQAGNVVSWTIPSLDLGQILTRTFSVTASRTITNSDYRVSAEGNISTTGTVTVVTTISTPPDLTLTKSGPAVAAAGDPITYTLTVTNTGGLATNLVITDALPANATYIDGGTLIGQVVSWTIPTLDFGQTLTRTFTVTTSQTITNSDYRVSAGGNTSATGTISVVTVVRGEDAAGEIYLPLIMKQP